jgi:hypothetical protein
MLLCRSALGLALGAVLVAALPSAAGAAPITYTEQAIASGSLGSLDFSDTLVTITVTADTSGASGSSGLAFNTGQASVTVGSAGAAAFLDPLTAYVFGGAGSTILGITDGALFADLLDTSLPGGLAYDLTTAIGPLSGTSLFSPAAFFATSAGDLNLLSAGGSTFSADIPAVPEPASLALFGCAAAVLVVLRSKRRNAAY